MEILILFVYLCVCARSIHLHVHKAKVTSSDALSPRKTIMEACNVVEREVDKILLKFGVVNEHAETVLQDLINHVESLKKEFAEGILKAFTILTMSLFVDIYKKIKSFGNRDIISNCKKERKKI